MADISAKEVMALRQRTGLSMMECKKALQETGGDAAAAEEFLRVKLKGKMETRTDRAAGEGRIAIATKGSAAAIVELRAETDFTAKNDAFQDAARKVAEFALAQPEGEVAPSEDMNKLIDNLRISTGENISIGRIARMDADSFGTYIHHDGKTGVLLGAKGSIDEAVARDVCMHITAAMPRPQGVSRDDIPAEVIEKERKFAEAEAEGKPPEIAKRIVDGKIEKVYADLALLDQPFVKDDSKKIKDIVGGATLTKFYRWEVGGN
ncbi:MAG: translation elongation factor Ts [Phycisphaerales bacterium]